MNLLERIESIEALQSQLGKELQEKQHEYLSSKGFEIREITEVLNSFTYEHVERKLLTCDIDSAMEYADD